MNKRILTQCERLARKKSNPQSHPEFKNFIHFSFIVQNNKIVEWGINRKHTPLINPDYPRKLHSEESAAKKAKGVLDKLQPWEVVNIRLSRTGELRISKPCPYCQSYLKLIGCSCAWYTTDSGWRKMNIN